MANGFGVAVAIVGFAFGIAAGFGHGFSTWPLWGQALSVVAALVIISVGAVRDSDSQWPKPPVPPPEGEAPK